MQNLLNEILEDARPAAEEGRVATYIPELGNADPRWLGCSICTADGEIWSAGETTRRFSMQSISKILLLVRALELFGMEKVFRKVGMEPSGDAFDSLVELDLNSNYPFNPMINTGAIAVSSSLVPATSFEEMLDFARRLCRDGDITLNEKVCRSEMGHLSRNRAIGYLLESKGVMESDVEQSLELYVKMCSLNVNAEDLARLGGLLACGGACPGSGEQLVEPWITRVVKTLMLTCGMYDGSGRFAVKVGIPSKSGVGGGILSVVNRKMGIGVFGPALDRKGNSLAGQQILEKLSARLDLHIFS